MTQKTKYRLIILGAVVIIIGVALWKTYKNNIQTQSISVDVPKLIHNTSPSESSSNHSTNSNDSLTMRDDMWLSVAFTSQAPTANWDEDHNQGCEEAVAIMAQNYFAGFSDHGGLNIITPEYYETEFAKLTAWEDKNYNNHLSITTAQTANMIEQVYGLKTTVVSYDSETLKKSLLGSDKLIILPTNGQLLKNPHFKSPGPIYHMLLVTGYNPTQIVTNDPGTKFGYNYTYSYDTIQNSVGSWDPNTNSVDLSKKDMIIVSQ